jgi:hypothetical protein
MESDARNGKEEGKEMRTLKLGIEILTSVHLKSGMSQVHAEESINTIVKVMRTYAQIGVLQAAGCNALGLFAIGRKDGKSLAWSKAWLNALLYGSEVRLRRK